MSLWIRAGILGLVLSLGATTSWAAYRGQVVDADTKEPIEGVVVVMAWSYLQFSLMPHAHEFAEAYETLTDTEGRFSLPRWWSLNPWKLAFADNSLTIFKSGYEPVIGGSWWALLEYEWGADKGSIVWKSEDGQPVILLRKFRTLQEMSESDKKRGAFPSAPDEKMKLLRRELDKEYDLIRECRKSRQC